jgi:thiosulfate dehydrogenase [quinone] large subunit
MKALERIKDPRLVGAAWLVARVWVGWQFLEAGWRKVAGADRTIWVGDQAGDEVRTFFGKALERAPGGPLAGKHPEVLGWYAALIRHDLLPNAEAFSYLVAFGEVLVGLALILGIATRFAAAMGLLMNVSYLLGGANGVGPLMVLIEMSLLLVGATAGSYGVDRWLLPYLRGRLTVPQWRPTPSPSPRPG